MIGGFTLPSNGTHGWALCCLGTTSGKKLIYAGRTGTGFTQKTHRSARRQLEELRQRCDVRLRSRRRRLRQGAIWVKPQLVAQVNFATWTADNLVRQASFKGLREDKPANEVRREKPTVAARSHDTKYASYATSSGIAAKAARLKAVTAKGFENESSAQRL